MSLPISIDDLYFGERDALHEFMKQDRSSSSILDNSFVNPPKVKLADLQKGSRFFIVGPKGSGKTTLLMHLKRAGIPDKSKIILFKSQLRKEDRDQLDKMIDMIVVEDQNTFRLESDYKTIWEWYVLKNVVRLIDPSDVLEGLDYYKDMVLLLEADRHKFNTLYDKFNLESAKGTVKLGFDVGALKSEISAEINSRRTADNKVPLLDLVRLVQASLRSIKLKSSAQVRLYFDELEFFMSEDGDGDRDRRMVRDLIFSVYSSNVIFSDSGLDVVVYASIRSEILNSINTTTQELYRSVEAFGVFLDWHNEEIEGHPVLAIYENKVRNSEIEAVGAYSDDVWTTYFPALVRGKEFRKYLLDYGLHRPRGVLLRLNAAAHLAYGKSSISEDDFIDSEEKFGEMMMDEFSDEISASFDEPGKEVILSLLRGNKFDFTREQMALRVNSLPMHDKKAKFVREKIGTENIIRLLFRVGLIGNQFDIPGTDKHRQEWAFRGRADPLMDKRFVVHQSVRKALATV